MSHRKILDSNGTKPKQKGESLLETITDRMSQLDAEIQFFQRENQKLIKSRQSEMQINIAQQNLRKEIADFEKRKTEEIFQIQALKEELSKIQKERKVLLSTRKETRTDKVEVEKLKQQVTALEHQLKTERSKSKATIDRLTSRAEVLTQRNQELELQVRILEKQRIKDWS